MNRVAKRSKKKRPSGTAQAPLGKGGEVRGRGRGGRRAPTPQSNLLLLYPLRKRADQLNPWGFTLYA